MELSFIIVTHNSEEYISDCLNSTVRSAQSIDREILVIDNYSMDQTKTLVREFPYPLTLIENDENLGFAKAVNLGLKKSSGEFILLLNPDTMIKSDSLSPVLVFMRDNAKVGICGCKLLNKNGTLQYSKGSFPTIFSILYRFVLPRRMRKYHLRGYNNIGECDWVTGAFMLIRKSLLNEVGYLDERYFAYYEDMDYCLQAKKAGWQVNYFPEISAYHTNPHPTSNKGSLIEKEIRLFRISFSKKNRYFLLSMLCTSKKDFLAF